MAIRYYLQPNPNTPDPNDQYARVETNDNVGIDELAEDLVREGGAVNAAAAKGTINALLAIIVRRVADGDAINLPLATIRPGITGVFIDVNDRFDPARHTVTGNLRPGPLLSDALDGATTEFFDKGAPSPRPTAFTNLNTGSTNALITPGGLGEVTGSELRFEKTDQTLGVFFLPEAGGAETRVATYGQVTDGKLSFLIPDSLTTGNYFLEVRRLYGTTNFQRRTGRLAFRLAVPV